MNERISVYSPSVEEQIRLTEEGITINELLQYDQPSQEELRNLQKYDIGLVEAILMTDLRKNAIDALNQIAPLTYPSFPQGDDYADRVRESQLHFIELSELRMSRNPYPGKGFSKEQLQTIVDLVKDQVWKPDTIGDYLSELYSLLRLPQKNG